MKISDFLNNFDFEETNIGVQLHIWIGQEDPEQNKNDTWTVLIWSDEKEGEEEKICTNVEEIVDLLNKYVND